MHDLLNGYFWIQIDSYKKHCFVQGTHRTCHGPFFQLFDWCSRVKILSIVTSVLQHFLCTGKILPTLRIDGNLPSENVCYIKSVRGSQRGFLNCLNSLFGMLRGPVFLRVFI